MAVLTFKRNCDTLRFSQVVAVPDRLTMASEETVMPHLSLGEFIVWLIVGALAGSLTGRVVTLKKEGFGPWINMGVGMIGALLGGFLFNFFKIDLGLGELKVTFEDLIAAFVGSLLCVGLWWVARKTRQRGQRAD
jgi:uncharacterized membrane protein YeaQ/YmgE (transglycosylase-associated protein family)